MDLPLENKIYKNNINVSIHRVQVHGKINRKEKFSHKIHNFHNMGGLW